MKSLAVRLGQKIARQRKAVGLTQAQLAERIGMQPETISRLETGKRSVSLSVIASLSEVLGLELHELFQFHGADSPKDKAMGRLHWFASRLSAEEIELALAVSSVVLLQTRRMLAKERP